MTDYMNASTLNDLIRLIMSTIDRNAYFILSIAYQIFFNVATAELFSNALVKDFYYRCQLIIGVFMLFKFAVTILEGIVDPNKATDKKAGAGKIVSRIITSLIILALITPINIPNPRNEWERQLNNNGIIFGALYSLQNRILSNNTIGKLVLGTTETEENNNNNTSVTGGAASFIGDVSDVTGNVIAGTSTASNRFASSILRAFLRINLEPDKSKWKTEEGKDPEYFNENRACPNMSNKVLNIYKNPDANPQELLTLVNVDCETASGSGLASLWGSIKKLAGAGTYAFAYSFLLSGISALIIAIILIGYTVDIAIRAIKLAVLRLIAPIPIISHMSISAKEAKGEDTFSLWTKAVISTYIDLFTRLIIIYFVIYLIQDMLQNGIVIRTGTGIVGAISFVFIVIGLFLFARQAPKFIRDVLGIQGTGSNIGLSAILASAGAIRQGGTLRDARWAAQDAVDNNINAYNSGKAAPGLGMTYNAGRDLAAQMITGNDKMTARAMARGRSILSSEGITTDIAGKYKNDMYLQKNILQAMEDAQSKGYEEEGQHKGKYAVYYKTGQKDINGNDIYQTKYIDKDDWAEAIARQRDRTTQAESTYNDMKAEQQKYGQTVGYREKARGRKTPYASTRRAGHLGPTLATNWHDSVATEFNRDSPEVDPVIGDQL